MISSLQDLGFDFKDEGENYLPKKEYSENLVAKYSFDSNGVSGTTLKDLSGKGNDGIMSGVTITNDGDESWGCFDGNASISFNNHIIPSGDKTIIITLKKDPNTQHNDVEYVVKQGAGGSSTTDPTAWSVRFDSLGGGAGDLYFCNDNSSITVLNSHPHASNLCDGKKHTTVFNYYAGKTNNIYCDSLKAVVASNNLSDEYYTNDNTIVGQNFRGYIKSIEIYNTVIKYDSLSTGISLNKSTDTIYKGQNDTLAAVVMPEDTTDKSVEWTSSDPTVASVDQTGKVTALKEGVAVITASTKDGSNLSAACTIDVIDISEPDRACLNISMTNGQVKQYNVTMNEVNKFISWYRLRSAGSEEPFYEFDITQVSQPETLINDYVVFEKISSFTVNDYTK